MTTTRTLEITPAVLSVFRDCSTTPTTITLPKQLDRKLYLKVDEALKTMGYRWSRTTRQHVAAEPWLHDADAADVLADAINCGKIIDTKKTYQSYATPPKLAKKLADGLVQEFGPHLSALEPSAGTGNLVTALLTHEQVTVTAVEIQASLTASQLSTDRCRWVTGDFLKRRSAELGIFHAVLMNPPFSHGRDMEHVRHAATFASRGLWAVMSPGFTFRQDQKALAFREWLNTWKYEMIDLPPSSFRESGTDAATVLLKIWF